jgi:hypothetical protein
MKKTAWIAAALLCLIPLNGCGEGPVGAQMGSAPANSVSASAEPSSAETPEPAETPAPTLVPTPAPQGVLPEEDYAFFLRVGFAAEADGQLTTAKWAAPIRIQAAGKPGSGDAKALGAFVSRLKGIRGMPEIAFVTEGGNITIGFLPVKQAVEIDASFNDSDTAQLAIQWNGSNPVSARIFLADELTGQQARDSALAGLLLRSLGLGQDGQNEHADSALNANGAGTGPSELDWLMLALLYSPEVQPGLQADAAMPAVRALDLQMVSGLSANSPNISTADVLAYFNEVGFWWSGKASDGIVCKWASPVKLQVEGSPQDSLRQLLDDYIEQLNQVEGFPGLAQAQSGGTLFISFQSSSELKEDYPAMTAEESCYIKLTRSGGKITKCTIGVATDFADEATARTQFLRLLIKAVGFEYTSEAWHDSILNYDSSPQDWSALDWKMVELLYREDVKPGAKRAAVMKMLRSE